MLTISLFADSYDFDEHKYVFAIANTFDKSGNIKFTKNKVIITYTLPKYKKIIKENDKVSIQGKSEKVYYLKGQALFRTKQFIDIMVRLGQAKEIRNNPDFDVKKFKDKIILTFKGEMKKVLPKAEVVMERKKVRSFKLFMKNNDTLEIVKR